MADTHSFAPSKVPEVTLGFWIVKIFATTLVHYEVGESFGNPYGPSRRAALALMKLPILG